MSIKLKTGDIVTLEYEVLHGNRTITGVLLYKNQKTTLKMMLGGPRLHVFLTQFGDVRHIYQFSSHWYGDYANINVEKLNV